MAADASYVFGEHSNITPYVLEEDSRLTPTVLYSSSKISGDLGEALVQLLLRRQSWQNLLYPRPPKIEIFHIHGDRGDARLDTSETALDPIEAAFHPIEAAFHPIEAAFDTLEATAHISYIRLQLSHMYCDLDEYGFHFGRCHRPRSC